MSASHILYITDDRALLVDCPPQEEPGRREFPVGSADLPGKPHDLREFAEKLGGLIVDAFPAGLQCRLIIPSSWCFIGVVEDASKLDDQAVVFELEQWLPVELESVTAAVARLPGGDAVVPAVFTAPLRAFIEALEEHRIKIESIVPDGPLLLSGAQFESGAIALVDERRAFLAGVLGGHMRVRSVRLAREKSPRGEQLLFAARTVGLSNDSAVNLFNVAEDSSQRGSFREFIRCITSSDGNMVPIDHLFNLAATDEAGPDLRRGELSFAGRWEPVHNGIRRTLWTVSILLAVLWGRWAWDGWRFRQGLEALMACEAQLFREAMPGSGLPSAPALRLRSEVIRLEGLTSAGAGEEIPTEGGLALLMRLRELVRAFPPDLKLDLTEMLIEANHVKLAGATTSHDAAGRLVAALNTIPVVSAEPPRTKLRPDGGVDFSVTVTLESDDFVTSGNADHAASIPAR